MELYSWDDYRRKRLTEEEIEEINKRAKARAEALINIQEGLKNAIEELQGKIGFNEIVRRMRTSSSQLLKIKQGKANVTIHTISQIAALMGKQPHEIITPKKK